MRLKSVLFAFLLMIIVGSVFRLLGFAPQIAMAVFGGAVIRDRKLAFGLPLLSMFLSDVLYEVLFRQGYLPYGGFYDGQVVNYLLITALTFFGFLARNGNPGRMTLATVAAPLAFFLASNFLVWSSGGGFGRPMTFEGLMMCYNDGLPFLRPSLVNTAVSSTILFGGYYLVQRFFLTDRLSRQPI